jgi:hypothetical protein
MNLNVLKNGWKSCTVSALEFGKFVTSGIEAKEAVFFFIAPLSFFARSRYVCLMSTPPPTAEAWLADLLRSNRAALALPPAAGPAP